MFFILLILLNLLTKINAYEAIPLTKYLGSGYDLKTTLYGFPIFEFTYDNELYTTPHTNITYKVPNELSIKPYPYVHELTKNSQCSTYSDYLEQYSKWFKFDVAINVGKFSAGLGYNKAMQQVYKMLQYHNASMSTGFKYFIFNIGVLGPSFILNKTNLFTLALNKLPSEIKTDRDQYLYFQFFKTFGTHYPEKILSGGKVEFAAAINNDLLNRESSSWVSEQFSLSFHFSLFNFSTGGFYNRSEIHINETFSKEAITNVNFFGGDPILANLDNSDEWLKTIDEYMFPINVTLTGIWNLVEDQIKSHTMYKAVLAYLAAPSLKNANGNDYGLGSGFDTLTLEKPLNTILNPVSVYEYYITESKLTEAINTIQNDFDLQLSFHERFEDSYGFLDLGTKTTDYYHYYEMSIYHKKSLTKVIIDVAYKKLILKTFPVELNGVFSQAITLLPPYDSQNKTIVKYYEEIFKKYGTSVINHVVLGGSLEVNMWYDSSFDSVYSREYISESCKWSFLDIVSYESDKTHIHKKIDKNLNKTLVVEYKIIGGNSVYEITSYYDWLLTIQDHMAPIKYHLIPILDVIPVERKNDFTMALNEYIKKNQIKLF